MRRSRRPRSGPSQPCPETPLSCASPTSPAGRAPLLRRRDLLMLRPHDHHLDRRRAEADLTIETDQGLGGTTPARSGGRPARLVLPQLPTAVRAPLGAPRMSGIRARRAPRRSTRRRDRLCCTVGGSQHVWGEWGARCCDVTGQPMPAWSGIGCQQCSSGTQALAAWTLAIVLSCWRGPGGAARPLVRMFRPPGLVRS